ncbi:MAG: hypothetical protein AABX44_01700, partial [Nanoarchaeota archaeon]
MTIFGEEETEFKELIDDLKETVLQQKSILTEIKQLYAIKHLENEKLVSEQIKELTRELNKLNERIPKTLEGFVIPRIFPKHILNAPKFSTKKEEGFNELEKETIKRLRK